MRLLTTMMALLCLSAGVKAQNSIQKRSSILEIVGDDIRSGRVANPTLEAVKVNGNSLPTLDGILDEKIWQTVPVAAHFTQREPKDGVPATQKTRAKILYTDSHVYVGIIAFDTAPDSIVAPLFRRDGDESSDWVHVAFDSYNDKRTAFVFGVNPRGVQRDLMIYNNNNEDNSWDAVWETKARITDFGWTAELKIPLSQLRFDSNNSEQQWRVNFNRSVARTGEESFWRPTPQTSTGMVSNFGELTGIHDLDEPRRLEVMPYVSADLTRVPPQNSANPYYSRNDLSGQIGADLKYGITSDLTLSATLNPDFGQVEADPAVINLTANENFFEERRPFFLEGRDIFQFGRSKTFIRYNAPTQFYSRRIGRSPQGSASRAGIDAEYVDMPDYTTIAGAAKVSGKTKNGWSVGFLDAYTTKETAQFTSTTGQEDQFMVEPATNYLVSRLKKDFNQGQSYVGGFASAVNRSIDGTYFSDYLRSSAYVGGVDYEHQFGNEQWIASGAASFSSIHGSKDAIRLAQFSPVRHYDRVDSDYLSVDENATSLQGFSTELSVQKRGGDNWLGSVTYSETSPGYEVNDIGFQTRSDLRWAGAVAIYRETSPKYVQYYETFIGYDRGWNYDGDRIRNSVMNGGAVMFKNQWMFSYNLGYNFKQYTDRISRGGPVMERPEDWNFIANINTDRSKTVSFNLGGNLRREVAGEYDNAIWAGVNVRPATFMQISFNPEFVHQVDVDQYITAVNDANATHTYGSRYVFSDIEQTVVSASLRLNWTFTPTMSIQTYVRPFIATGRFSNFKEVARPYSYEYDVYGKDIGTVSQNGETYVIDPDGNGNSEAFSFRNPDFNFRSVQGNAVFRWEYLPGSTLFLVWQQQRDAQLGYGDFNFGRDFNGLFNAKPTNVFLVKLSYWFGT